MPAKRIALVVNAAVLVLAATALALAPRSGTYEGFTSGPVLAGFAPPVSFTVSSSGKTLSRFKYSTFGCGSFGGQSEQQGGDRYLTSSAIKSIGKVPLSTSGTFSVTNVKTSYAVSGEKTTTTTSISGKFTSKTGASGTITFSQSFVVPGHSVPGCGPVSVTFSVKRK